MNEWFYALSTIEKVFFFIATPASVTLILQSILTLFGFFGGSGELGEGVVPDSAEFDGDLSGAGFDGDVDFESNFDVGEVDLDAELSLEQAGRLTVKAASLKILTMRGLIALFAIGGWLGFMVGSSLHPILTVLLSLAGGMVAMVAVAFLFKIIQQFTQDGTLHLYNAIDKVGEVYVPIGAKGEKMGKIMIEAQGRLIEIDAVTRSETELKVGTRVRVVGLKSEDVAIVREEEEQKNQNPQ